MFSSSYFSSAYLSASYWSGISAAVAVSTGGGNAVSLALPAGWRQITDDELRASARRADRRRRAEEKRPRRRKKVEPVALASVPPAPVPTSSPEVDRLIDAITSPGVEDVGERMRARELAAALARARETAELLRTERRVMVGKLARRMVVRLTTRRAGVVVHDVLKADPRVLVREEERRDEVHMDRRASVTCLTLLR